MRENFQDPGPMLHTSKESTPKRGDLVIIPKRGEIALPPKVAGMLPPPLWLKKEFFVSVRPDTLCLADTLHIFELSLRPGQQYQHNILLPKK